MSIQYGKAAFYLDGKRLPGEFISEIKITEQPAERRAVLSRGLSGYMPQRFIHRESATIITLDKDMIDPISARLAVEAAGMRLISIEQSHERPNSFQIAIEDSPQGFEHTKETAARALVERIVEIKRQGVEAQQKKLQAVVSQSVNIMSLQAAKQKARTGGGNARQYRKRWRAILREMQSTVSP